MSNLRQITEKAGAIRVDSRTGQYKTQTDDQQGGLNQDLSDLNYENEGYQNI
jgi:hypothetical protein